MKIRRIDRLVIAAVALHSLVLGAAMLFAPAWTLKMAGWDYQGPLFYPAQSGVFLLILGGGYVAGIWIRPFAWFLVASKAVAVLFLVSEYAVGAAPFVVFLGALFDGLMGLSVVVAILWVSWNERTKTKPRA